MSIVADKIKNLDEQVDKIEKEQEDLLLTIPNMLHSSVPFGLGEEDNIEIRRWGQAKEFNFEVKSHDELGTKLNILDFERGVKLSWFKICCLVEGLEQN